MNKMNPWIISSWSSNYCKLSHFKIGTWSSILVKNRRIFASKASLDHHFLRRNNAKRKQRTESIDDKATISTATSTRVRIAVFSCRNTRREHENISSSSTTTKFEYQKLFPWTFVFISINYNKHGEAKSFW